MKKHLLTIPLLLTLLGLAACGTASRGLQAASPPSSGSLPMATQLLIGTMKLDGTEQDVTAEQAAELLPLWQVYGELLASDTAAQEEMDGLVAQIQETMTEEQMQAVSDMALTQQDVFALMQEKGSGIIQSSEDSRPDIQPSGEFGGPPDGGRMFLGEGGMGGGIPPEGQTSNRSAGTTTEAGPGSMGGRAPSVLIEALIEMLESKIGS